MKASLVRLMLSSLLLFGPLAASAAGVVLSIAGNRTNVAPGSDLVISVTADNPGLNANADFYIGIVLPDGDTVITFTDLNLNVAVGHLSTPSTLQPIVRGVDLQTPFHFEDPDFLHHEVQGTEPSGRYVTFVAAVQANALDDDFVDAGEVIALDTADVNLFGPVPGVVEARLEHNYKRAQFGGERTEPVLNVFFDAPEGTIQSVTVTGGPFSATDVPLGSQMARDGQLFDVFNLRQTTFEFPDVNEIFTFEAQPFVGPPQSFQTTFRNTPTLEAIDITNLLAAAPDPFALAAAHLGEPLFVQWTLPSFTIEEVMLSPVVHNADNTFCHGEAPQMLPPDATSGSVVFPTTCDAEPVTKASVCVFITGLLGEKTAACHFFVDPPPPMTGAAETRGP